MKRICVISLLLLALTGSSTVLADRARGPVHAVDGDTLMMGKREIHLYGLDAPELGQPCTRDGDATDCGELSKAALQALVQGQTVTCYKATHLSVFEGICKIGRTNLNHAMLKQGWAMVNREYTNYYAGYESIARRKNLNLWSMQLDKPWEWRQSNHAGEDPEQNHRGRCISAAGTVVC